MWNLARLSLRRAMPVVVCCACSSVSAAAQTAHGTFAGAVAGVSTLSADAQFAITPERTAVSLYKPENGSALDVLFGVHLGEFVAVQANYIWNRNDLGVVAVSAAGSGGTLAEEARSTSQHAVIGDLVVYVRNLESRIRPYLSVGGGAVRIATAPNEDGPTTGGRSSVSTRAALRVAVGVDVALKHGWSLRYSFSETLSSNPIGAQLTPPGARNLANFQNLLGIVRAL